MPNDLPTVRFVLSVCCDERGEALRGEAAVVVADETVHQQSVPVADLEGHISHAVMVLRDRAKEALDALSSTKPAADPPPTKPKQPRRRKGQPKVLPARGVSISRLR